MLKKQGMMQLLSVAALCMGLAACGGGGGEGDSGGPASVAYAETTPGPGSTIADAEVAVTNGIIKYLNFQLPNTPLSDKGYFTILVTSTVSFNTASKAGSIQFPILGGIELISTTDGYATTTWTGPFKTGQYRLNGNVMMGCNAAATVPHEATQVFVSNTLERVSGAVRMEELKGHTFDVLDCSTTQGQTMKFNTDGTLTMSWVKDVVTQNQVINMLNPEQFGGALFDKYYGGQVFRFGKNGVSKYAIVMQSSTGNFNSRYRYFLAVQR